MGNTSVIGGRLPGLGPSDIRQILEALNELAGDTAMSVIELANDPTSVATAAAMGQLGSYEGSLYLHVTDAADVKWLDLSALQAEAGDLASLVASKAAILALAAQSVGLLALQAEAGDLASLVASKAAILDLAAQSVGLLALQADGAVIPRLRVLEVDLVALVGEGYGSNVDVRQYVAMTAFPAGAVVTSVYGAVTEAAAAVGLTAATVSFGWENEGDPEAALAELNAMVATDNNSEHGHGALGVSVAGKKVDISIHLTGATVSDLTAGKLRLIVGYVLG